METDFVGQLVTYRLLVGYLGEKEQYGWWQSSFFTQGAGAFLTPLFPRTQMLAQCNGVTQAAALVHDERIGVGHVYHLFRRPEDLEQSIRHLRETTEGAKAIVERVSKVVGVGSQASRADEQPKPPPLPSGKGPKVDFLFDSDRGKFRTDVNFTHQLRSGDFLRIGGYDLGENTKLNLQAGKILKPGHAFRGGLYRSRLGIGYDWQASDKWMLQGDLYRPNAPRVDVKGLIDLTPGYGGWLGFEDIGGSNRAVAGVQFKF